MIAIDTNILVGSIQTFDPALRNTARRAVKSLHRDGEQLFCFPQNLVEFWNASTRPANRNGLGFSPEQAGRYVDRFQTFFRLLPETPELFKAWRKSWLSTGSPGSKSTMPALSQPWAFIQVRKILTFDLNDFNRYGNITVIHPSTV